MQFHARLAWAIENYGPERKRPVDFHTEMRKRGVEGVHGSYRSLTRWLEGGGHPPDSWIETAAQVLHPVSVRWLKRGEGPRTVDGSTPAPDRIAVKRETTFGTIPVGTKPAADAAKVPKRTRNAPPPPPSVEIPPMRPLPTEKMVWQASETAVRSHIAQADDRSEVAHIRAVELRNPEHPGGRTLVLERCDERLAEIDFEAKLES